ncbi:MAG: hypothetical protein ACRD4Y_09745, partial [Candidatus Acidiferrales bacterium]
MTNRRLLIPGVALLAAWSVFAAGSLCAQETQGPIAPKPGEPIQNSPEPAIRVKVQVVNVPVTVRDAKGELVLDLRQKDFHVLDNGAPQTIDTFYLGGEPLDCALIFETSSQIAPLLPAVRKSAIVFTQTVVGPSG